MVKVFPMNGIVYNPSKVDMNDVMAPPYDVIPEDEQNELYEKSEFNIVKLILGKIKTTDNESENRYTRAKDSFIKWKDSEVLVESEKPSIYYYIQSYKDAKGNEINRKGFIANAEIEEFEKGNIIPHEYTMGGPKADRLKLMKECKANFSQIFMVYSDKEFAIDKALVLPKDPFIDVMDKNGVRNIVYVIDNSDSIAKICQIMEDKKLLIADGHHRYETGLAYRNFMREKTGDNGISANYNRIMCYFTNMNDDGLQVYPTHRIVTKYVNQEKLLGQMSQYFKVSEYSNKEELMAKLEDVSLSNIAFGTYFKNSKVYQLFELSDKNAVDAILEAKNVPDVLKKLDLIVLHKIVVTDFLGISEEDQSAQQGIKYIKKEEEAFLALENNSAEMVFLMASPKISQIEEISQAGYRMPQKSTYFYPKLLSGLVLNSLD